MIVKKAWIPGRGTYSVSATSEPFNPTQGQLGLQDAPPKDIDFQLSDAEDCHPSLCLAINWNRLRLATGEKPQWHEVAGFPFASDVKKMSNMISRRSNGCIQQNAFPLPKRITVVGKPSEESISHDTGNIHGPYANLSYCWGDNQNLLKTTSTSLEKHKKGISLTQLPKTIRDAVYITKELAIGYHWVDSLFILQDSVKGWEVESVQMGECFKNAHVAIAASAASHA
ncbi:Uncharacterized protein HZ326_22605 [Fusarium oxysporum f. sp. albedinis]|nr:Uncharacterized protein HZ326_22605 [Fusarium oxysporum f. sp. albedinis]